MVLGFWEMDREDLLENPLSGAWSMERFRENPVDAATTMAICYPLGMIGYAFSLPVRVTIFVATFFNMCRHLFMEVAYRLFDCDWAWNADFPEHLMVFLGATGELFSGVIGVACPPLAYKIDSFIQSNEAIHKWYSKHFMSTRADIAMDPDFGEIDNNNGPYYGDPLGGVGNEDRMVNKQERIKEHYSSYDKAKVQLQTYLDNEQFETMMDNIFQAVLKAALLEMLKTDSKYLESDIYGEKIADLKPIWKKVPARDRENVAKGVLYEIVVTTPEEDEPDQIKQQDFLLQEQVRLEKYDDTIEQVHSALVAVVGDFGSKDRESYTLYIGHTFPL